MGARMPHSDDLRQLLQSFRQIARALDVQSRRIDRQFGLTLPQLIVLQCVSELGEVTSRTVSAAAGLSPPNVVGVMDKLEAKGLIRRYRSTSDRRIVHTELTERGRAVAADAPLPLGARFAERFAALPRERRSDILAALRQVADMVDSDVDAVSDADEAIG
jgi:DNA-binding MarR family transcriptional regulator